MNIPQLHHLRRSRDPGQQSEDASDGERASMTAPQHHLQRRQPASPWGVDPTRTLQVQYFYGQQFHTKLCSVIEPLRMVSWEVMFFKPFMPDPKRASCNLLFGLSSQVKKSPSKLSALFKEALVG